MRGAARTNVQPGSACHKAEEDKGYPVLVLDPLGIGTNYCDGQARPSWLKYPT